MCWCPGQPSISSTTTCCGTVEYDVASFFRQDGGIYGRVNARGGDLLCRGILVQLPFIASALYTGAVARAIGGIDLSWIVGLAVTSPAYYWLAKRSQTRAEGAARLHKPPAGPKLIPL